MNVMYEYVFVNLSKCGNHRRRRFSGRPRRIDIGTEMEERKIQGEVKETKENWKAEKHVIKKDNFE